MTVRPLRLAIVAGEESGDLLGADLAGAIARMTGCPIELIGVGGRHLAALGQRSLFDPSEIAIMGLSAVVRDLPNLLRRIGQTAHAIVAAKPDCLITIDSPAFTMRVAKKVRAAAPSIPIVKYVCPSVWAWGPWRAKAMKAYTDHVLCLLPFEPAELARLDGPPGTYVGHRLTHDPDMLATRAAQRMRAREDGARTLLLLPGSRRAEVGGLIDVFGETVSILAARGCEPRLLLPTVPNVAWIVRERTAGWARQPEIIEGAEGKWRAFAEADAALCASGTVSLELALAGVPLVSTYRTDPLFSVASRYLITTWTASLPNLVADAPVVPEYFNFYLRPGKLARHVEMLMAETPARAAQLDGFARIAERLATDRPASEIASGIVLEIVERARQSP